ncbi:MAG: hypothetical protein IJ079_03885 [Lachnospiraceae bacterium]|nr:hypothetical protein [Lachnospiraceae bacterium]MBR1567549.1 hypothetical protein [Lachnospiraceae bacterium]MBR1568705.1 hypothetical protein [Lachnospiraceae bacterium]
MIVTVEEALEAIGQEVDETALTRKIKAVESAIRDYTNNNFQQRAVQFRASTSNHYIKAANEYLQVGDNIQISRSHNQGVYTIMEISDQGIRVNDRLYDCPSNLITKVEYPPAVQEGVLNLLKWDYNNRDKVGIKSETISRHSVTYYDQDNNNQLMGYPVSLIGFLDPYILPVF